jgi:hypothetical protein
MVLQAFGLAELGKRFVDCLPGTDVLWTCSSKSSAEARFCFDILVAFDRLPRVLVFDRPVYLQRLDFARFMQD